MGKKKTESSAVCKVCGKQEIFARGYCHSCYCLVYKCRSGVMMNAHRRRG